VLCRKSQNSNDVCWKRYFWISFFFFLCCFARINIANRCVLSPSLQTFGIETDRQSRNWFTSASSLLGRLISSPPRYFIYMILSRACQSSSKSCTTNERKAKLICCCFSSIVKIGRNIISNVLHDLKFRTQMMCREKKRSEAEAGNAQKPEESSVKKTLDQEYRMCC
jgi:hypothetical protein